MARSKIVFGKTAGDTVEVDGDPERVAETLRSGWAQLNRASEGDEPDWIWVNADQVVYVEPVQKRKYEKRS